jgi:hypothetical protein
VRRLDEDPIENMLKPDRDDQLDASVEDRQGLGASRRPSAA